MEILVKTKWVLTWLAMLPLDKFSSKRKMVAVVLAALAASTISLTCFAAHLAFILKFLKARPTDALFAACGLVAFGSNSYILIAPFFLRHEIRAIFDRLSMIYDASKCKLA